MKTKHTPGPWSAERMLNPPKAKDRRCGFVVNGPKSGEPLPSRICDLRVPPGIGSFSEYQANARLIAAAPELLQALKDAKHYLEIHADDPRTRNFISLQLNPVISKAIA